jgi:hypothetical protein
VDNSSPSDEKEINLAVMAAPLGSDLPEVVQKLPPATSPAPAPPPHSSEQIDIPRVTTTAAPVAEVEAPARMSPTASLEQYSSLPEVVPPPDDLEVVTADEGLEVARLRAEKMRLRERRERLMRLELLDEEEARLDRQLEERLKGSNGLK